jgi:hypothetical protein
MEAVHVLEVLLDGYIVTAVRTSNERNMILPFHLVLGLRNGLFLSECVLKLVVYCEDYCLSPLTCDAV